MLGVQMTELMGSLPVSNALLPSCLAGCMKNSFGGCCTRPSPLCIQRTACCSTDSRFRTIFQKDIKEDYEITGFVKGIEAKLRGNVDESCLSPENGQVSYPLRSR